MTGNTVNCVSGNGAVIDTVPDHRSGDGLLFVPPRGQFTLGLHFGPVFYLVHRPRKREGGAESLTCYASDSLSITVDLQALSQSKTAWHCVGRLRLVRLYNGAYSRAMRS